MVLPSVVNPLATPAWEALRAHAPHMASLHLRDLLQDEHRFATCSLQLDGLLGMDFTRCRISSDTLDLLEQLATQCKVPEAIAALLAGVQVNVSEQRAAFHSGLRAGAERLPPIDGVDITAEVAAERERFLEFADAVRTGRRTGMTGQSFRTVINIGIGGSDLGPRFLTDALGERHDTLQLHFVAGLDGIELERALAHSEPSSTLIVVCSKTFTTRETMANASRARDWIIKALGSAACSRHFVAVSTNTAAMDRFGVADDARFAMWDWVGGRYSLWSAVGLSAAIALGRETFLELLQGARQMDQHFAVAPCRQNLPVMLALLTVWHQNFLGADQHVVLPYDQRLAGLPAYLQQLWMESLGKLVSRDGNSLAYPTGSALWGTTGSHAQHSFAQWLHQGAAAALTVYIAAARPDNPERRDLQRAALANMLAQADSLARGRSGVELADDGNAAHKEHPGNRPSIVLLMPDLDARSLGMLLALYEHCVYVQAAIWGINPFDQWGVEYGKQVASRYEDALQSGKTGSLPGIGRWLREWGA